ncbi:MAG: PHP-associated domain-containing protein [Nanoarchaeota archaeon]
MSLISDVSTLVGQGLRHSAHPETLRALPHFVHDLVLGASPPPKDPNRIYMDLHAHVAESAPITEVLEKASRNVDILALTGRQGSDNQGHLDLEGAVRKLEDERIDHTRLGKRIVATVVGDNRFYLVQGLELYVRENQGMIVVGNHTVPQEQLSLADAIHRSEAAEAFWFLDHPFSIAAPRIGFRYPNQRELKEREKWFEIYKPVIEVGNHQNTLWMYPSNVAAQRWADKYDLVGIANSDSHFNISEYGLSRTSVPANLIDLSSEDAFFASLQAAFSRKNKPSVKAEVGYSSLVSFGRYMIAPTLAKGFQK